MLKTRRLFLGAILIISILFITNMYSSACHAQWNGKPVLLVLYGAADNYSQYYIKALKDNGIKFDIWDIQASGQLNIDKALEYQKGVIIRATNPRFAASSAITEEEAGVIMDFVSSKGALLLFGQDLGDAAYNSQLPGYLRVNITEKNYYPKHIYGVNRDFITNGMTIDFNSEKPGADSAADLTHCDAIEPVDNCEPIFYYDAAQTLVAGIKVQTCTFRACYMGFGIEGISGAKNRSEVMYRSVDWLMGNNMMIGVKAPGFVMNKLDGTEVALHTEGINCAENKIWLVEFWATWCTDCSAFRPKLAEVYSKYNDDIEVFAITYKENAAVINKYLAAHPEVKWRIYMEDSGRAMQKYGVKSIPAVFLIDAKAREVQYIGSGSSVAELSSEIEKIKKAATQKDRFDALNQK